MLDFTTTLIPHSLLIEIDPNERRIDQLARYMYAAQNLLSKQLTEAKLSRFTDSASGASYISSLTTAMENLSDAIVAIRLMQNIGYFIEPGFVDPVFMSGQGAGV